MNDSERLLLIAKEYIEAHKQSDWIFASASGSVGRWEADRYSNIDLHIVVACPDQLPTGLHVPYGCHTIQLRIHSWAGSNLMRLLPWRSRFMAQARAVYDPYGVLEKLRPAAIEYFRSHEGRERMLMQSQQEVQHQLQCLGGCIQADELLSASVSVLEVWRAAAASLSWMRHENCSSGGLLSLIRSEEPHLYESFQNICSDNQARTEDRIVEALAAYRKYLRDNASGSSFALDPVMDQLASRKAERYAARGEWSYARWLLRSEALWCYKAAGGSIPQFEAHFRQLPDEVKEALGRLGVFAYMPHQLSELLLQVERLSELAQQAAGTEGSRWSADMSSPNRYREAE